MTIERTWVRVFWSTTGRVVGTLAGLFALIVVAPIVLAVFGLWLIAVFALLVGVALAAALAFVLLPGHRRY